MVAKMFIGLLVAIVLVLLYRGMRQEQAAVDPRTPVDVKKILAVLRAKSLPCDTVISFTPLGKSRDDANWDGYLARCQDGGRYIYFQNPTHGQLGVSSCQQAAFDYGYRCPE